MNLEDERWPAMEPPVDFADRVATRWSARRSRALAFTVAACSLAAALLLLAWFRVERGEQAGELVAASRTTVEIGDRAIAVAEPDTLLSWSRGDDGWRVRQDRGSAFYRVDDGDSFVVETPEGTIAVTGTCFAVEVHTMNPTTARLLAPVGIASALTAVTVVSLYEGGVVLANASGDALALRPGERAALIDGREPTNLDEAVLAESTAKPAAGQARVALGAQQREIEALRERVEAGRKEVAALEAELQALELPEGSPQWVRECARSSGTMENCDDVEPPQEVLDEMARCGTIKADIPGFLYDRDALSPWATQLAVDDEEATAIEAAADQFASEYREAWVDITIAAGLSPEVARELPWQALDGWLQDEFELEQAERDAIQQQIARERAGHVPPRDPSQYSLAERIVRLNYDVGNAFERMLAQKVGPERARELRRAHAGWDGGRGVSGGSACSEEK